MFLKCIALHSISLRCIAFSGENVPLARWPRHVFWPLLVVKNPWPCSKKHFRTLLSLGTVYYRIYTGTNSLKSKYLSQPKCHCLMGPCIVSRASSAGVQRSYATDCILLHWIVMALRWIRLEIKFLRCSVLTATVSWQTTRIKYYPSNLLLFNASPVCFMSHLFLPQGILQFTIRYLSSHAFACNRRRGQCLHPHTLRETRRKEYSTNPCIQRRWKHEKTTPVRISWKDRNKLLQYLCQRQKESFHPWSRWRSIVRLQYNNLHGVRVSFRANVQHTFVFKCMEEEPTARGAKISRHRLRLHWDGEDGAGNSNTVRNPRFGMSWGHPAVHYSCMCAP